MTLALISIACFSDVSNSLQAMLICARISNAIGTDAFLHGVHQGCIAFPEILCALIAGFDHMRAIEIVSQDGG